MNQKKLGLLAVAVIALLGLFITTRSSYDSSKSPQAKELFGDLNPQKIYRIKIGQGEKVIDLELRGDKWTVPSKAGYPADESKVRALLVKLLDLSVSQEVTNNPARFESLGVGDDLKKSGKSEVSFLDSTGGIISGVLLGEQRKRGSTSPETAVAAGQYVRRTDQNDVYLVPQPLTFDSAVSSWLNLDIVNVLASRLIGVAESGLENGAEKVLYELEEVTDSTANPREFVLKGQDQPAKALDSSVIAQIRAGIENFRALDVFPADDAAVQGLSFDRRTIFKVNNGLEYQVSTAEKDGKTFAKISVVFNAATAHALTEAAEKKAAAEKAAAQASSSAAPEASPAASPVPSPTASSSSGEAAPKDQMASAEEANKLNAEFSKWVYELAAFNSKKYRTTRDQLFKKPDEKPAAPARDPSKPPVNLQDLIKDLPDPSKK